MGTTKKKTKKKVIKKKLKQGAPTKLTADKKKFLLFLYKEGKTDKQAAKIVGIAESTINNWKRDNPKFLESIKESKKSIDEEVEAALLDNARGYTYNETKALTVSAGQGLGSDVQIVNYQQFKPGETKAQIYWLQNRNSERWKTMKAVELTGRDGGPVEMEHSMESFMDEIDGESSALGE
jgi:DNA-binding XRE family transcriptional regulator